LNTLGYQLLYGDKRLSDATEIFRLNTMEHPASSNAFDSLGEAYMKNGDNGLAISSYRMALRIDPTNGHAAVMLKQAGIARVLSLTKAAISTVAILVVAVILYKRRSREAHTRMGDADSKAAPHE
jgi:tetratricopeptide (TPR) repeat protein